jgi:hypothetical protein
MKALYTENEYSQAKGKDLLSLECCYCQKTFQTTKTKLKYALKTGKLIKFCSFMCKGKAANRSVTDNCGFCGSLCTRQLKEYKGSKSGKIFCNSSCAAKYNNTHKVTGNRRSKIEIWIEQQLGILFPDLNILFNDKTAINSELDIYIPSLSLAFELNGIFHYEPIYGQKKLDQIQTNDNNKFYLCQRHNISLCIIDISKMIHFKPLKAQKFLDIISSIIYQNLNTPSRT